jgi:predicted transcriptional regulator
MTQAKSIRKQYFEEGRTVSEITRLTGYDRKTVSKYIEREDWNETLPDSTQRNPFPKLEPLS